MIWYDGRRSLRPYRFSDSAILISLSKKKKNTPLYNQQMYS